MQHKKGSPMGTVWMLRSIPSTLSSLKGAVAPTWPCHLLYLPFHHPLVGRKYQLCAVWEPPFCQPPANLSLAPCRMKKEEDSLTIFGVAERDQGSYTCVASTELDQDLAKAYLTVLGNGHHPHPHRQPFSLLPSSQSSCERWAVPGGCLVSSSQVQGPLQVSGLGGCRSPASRGGRFGVGS